MSWAFGSAEGGEGEGQPKGEEANLFGLKVPKWVFGDDGAPAAQQPGQEGGGGYGQQQDYGQQQFAPAPAPVDYSQYYNQGAAATVAAASAPPTGGPPL